VAVEDPDIVVEEVFENERFQPFRYEKVCTWVGLYWSYQMSGAI
jgi:hypothetical protein